MVTKKVSIILIVLLVLSLFVSCKSASDFEKQLNYEPTIEFYIHYHYSKYSGYRCIYDKKNNECIAISDDTKVGAFSTFYIDSKNYETVKKFAEQKELGQLNEYFFINSTEYYVFWSWTSQKINTLVKVENGQISTFRLYAGDAIKCNYYTDGEIVFSWDRSWDVSKKELVKTTVVFNIKTEEITMRTLPIYNYDIEKKFNVSDMVDLPFTERSLSTDRPVVETLYEGNQEVSIVSFSSSLVDERGQELSYWLQKRNLNTGEIENMKVVNSEYATEIYINDLGYSVISYSANKDNNNFVYGLNELYITQYDFEFNQLDKMRLDCEPFYDTVLFHSSMFNNEIFFIGSVPGGEKTCVSVYNIDTKTMTHSKNFIKGTEDGYCIVEKIDGKIHHLKMN